MKRASRRKNRSSVKVKAQVLLAWQYPALGLLLLPLLIAVCLGTWTVLRRVPVNFTLLWPILAGATAYGVFEFLFKKPVGLYVFGHELTHALAAFFTGVQVKSFAASPKGGAVVLNRTNVWVALAPYCFPIYTLLVVAVFLVLRLYVPFPVAPLWVRFAVGFTFAFHVALTLHALTQHQPDLRYVGPFLSLIIILLVNCVIVVLLGKVLFPRDVSFLFFLESSVKNVLVFLNWTLQTFLTLLRR